MGDSQKTMETLDRVANLLLEQTQLTRDQNEEQRADHLEGQRRLLEAAKTIETASKKIDSIGQAVEATAKSAFDMYATVEADRGYVTQLIQQAIEEAKRGAKHAEKGAKHAQKTEKRLVDMTGKFDTFRAAQLEKAAEAGRLPSSKMEPYWLILKAWSNLPLSTRIMSTIMFVALVAAFIVKIVETAK